jgi:UDP-N-acetyl-D-glucosamine dehydrogenase
VAELPQLGLTSVDLAEGIAEADLAVIVTAHPGIDHGHVTKTVPTLDFRGVTRTVPDVRHLTAQTKESV